MQVKIRIVLVIFILLFAGLTVRLSYWQIVMGKSLSERAKGQYNSSTVTSAPRGNILAADGSFLVLRNSVWQISANPKIIEDKPQAIAGKIAPFLTEDAENTASVSAEADRLKALLSKNNLSWVLLANKVADGAKKNIQALGIKGLNFAEQEGRFYPEASSSAQILGFVGKDENGEDIGYFGLEGYYNLPLSGKPGFLGQEKDARGVPILLGGNKEVSAIRGVDLVTSIDKRIQLMIEKKLEEGISKYGAVGGNITVMDPYTGEIMAMAALPSFDPQKYGTYGDSLFRNPVISNTFEPGSILKPIVMASALDTGLIRPDTPCDICSGPLNVDGFTLKTWNNEYTAGITMDETIIHSDNIGMSFVGKKMGADSMYDYLQKFGFGLKTGIDLQGEAAPPMRKKGTWSNVDLYTSSFGQGIAVTGLQMVRAVAAIANGGALPTPHIVKEIRGDGWQEKSDISPPVKIISEKAAAEAAQMMLNAANIGESKWAKVPGFDNIAAKTGTAQIPVAGHYDPTKTNHSFIGFAPVSRPRFVMLVTLQSPTLSPWAAETAAPVWYSVARELFPYLGIQPGPR
jgi:cell division protein FtsI/penicillin-binding protein 2